MSEIGSSDMLAGQVALLGAAMMFAIGSIIIRRMPVMPALPATSFLLILGGALLLPFGGHHALGIATDIITDNPGAAALTSLSALLFLALIPTGFGQFMRTHTIQHYGPVFYSLVGYFVPIWATVLGVMILGEPITTEIAIAFAVIMAGLLLAHDGGFAVNSKSSATASGSN
jgi:drug/metabolite transporter (DMT)-like permease